MSRPVITVNQSTKAVEGKSTHSCQISYADGNEFSLQIQAHGEGISPSDAHSMAGTALEAIAAELSKQPS